MGVAILVVNVGGGRYREVEDMSSLNENTEGSADELEDVSSISKVSLLLWVV